MTASLLLQLVYPPRERYLQTYKYATAMDSCTEALLTLLEKRNVQNQINSKAPMSSGENRTNSD